jgi:protein TonB
MILKRHYIVAITGATLVHLAALFLLTYSLEGGAIDKGEQGIEIDLGMLGDLGSAIENIESVAVEVEKIDDIEPIQAVEIAPQKISEKIISEQTSIEEIEPIVESKQIAVVNVKRNVVKKVEKIKDIEKPKALTETFEVLEQVVDTNTDQTIKVIKSQIVAKQEAENTAEIDQASHLKMTTGSANAMTSGGTTGKQLSYYSLIASLLAKHKTYPQYSRKKGQEGTVLLTFTILSSGLVRDINIEKSSGYRSLDRAVRKMLKEASPFPSHQKAQEMKISIPIVFKLNQALI